MLLAVPVAIPDVPCPGSRAEPEEARLAQRGLPANDFSHSFPIQHGSAIVLAVINLVSDDRASPPSRPEEESNHWLPMRGRSREPLRPTKHRVWCCFPV